MARYDLDYERSYGLGYRRAGRRGMEPGTRRSSRGRMMGGTGYGEGFTSEDWRARGGEYGGFPEYEREFSSRREMGEYGSEYRGTTGYGREFRKSRWQTDYGDPFHDRERGTPFRMIHGEFHGYGGEYLDYDEEYLGYGEELTTGWRESTPRRRGGMGRRGYGSYRGRREY